jgi:predicted DNA binding CopG/RHH family protein
MQANYRTNPIDAQTTSVNRCNANKSTGPKTNNGKLQSRRNAMCVARFSDCLAGKIAHIDWTKAERVRFPNLKPSTTTISLRLPVTLLERIKVAAKRDVPYQSLITTWLGEKTGTR